MIVRVWGRQSVNCRAEEDGRKKCKSSVFPFGDNEDEGRSHTHDLDFHHWK